jgi:hypothetical protein
MIRKEISYVIKAEPGSGKENPMVSFSSVTSDLSGKGQAKITLASYELIRKNSLFGT